MEGEMKGNTIIKKVERVRTEHRLLQCLCGNSSMASLTLTLTLTLGGVKLHLPVNSGLASQPRCKLESSCSAGSLNYITLN